MRMDVYCNVASFRLAKYDFARLSKALVDLEQITRKITALIPIHCQQSLVITM